MLFDVLARGCMFLSISHRLRLVTLMVLSVCSSTWAAEPSKEPSPLLPGLVATYSAADRKLSLIVPAPTFALRERDSVHPQLASDFLATWEGIVKIPLDSKYTFYGDGKIRIDGQDVGGKSISLSAGEHAIRIAYIREGGPVRYQLEWVSDAFAREPIPAHFLGHRQTPKEVAEQN